MAQLNFDATNVSPQAAFEILPAGWYTGYIVNSEMKPTKDGSGSYLNLELEIIAGQYAGRKAFDRLNINNANPKAVDIAYSTLSAICHATGVIQCADSEQLHGKPMQFKLSVAPASTDPATGTQYEAKNEVKGYKAVDASTSAPGAMQQVPSQWQPSAMPQQAQPIQQFAPQWQPQQSAPQTQPMTAPIAAQGAPWQQQAGPANQAQTQPQWQVPQAQGAPKAPWQK